MFLICFLVSILIVFFRERKGVVIDIVDVVFYFYWVEFSFEDWVKRVRVMGFYYRFFFSFFDLVKGVDGERILGRRDSVIGKDELYYIRI